MKKFDITNPLVCIDECFLCGKHGKTMTVNHFLRGICFECMSQDDYYKKVEKKEKEFLSEIRRSEK